MFFFSLPRWQKARWPLCRLSPLPSLPSPPSPPSSPSFPSFSNSEDTGASPGRRPTVTEEGRRRTVPVGQRHSWTAGQAAPPTPTPTIIHFSPTLTRPPTPTPPPSSHLPMAGPACANGTNIWAGVSSSCISKRAQSSALPTGSSPDRQWPAPAARSPRRSSASPVVGAARLPAGVARTS